jgi:hypothetical protein
MLSVGKFGSMGTIQDKRFGFLKRIPVTPTSKQTIFLTKALGSATRGLVQIPIMIAAAMAFGGGLPTLTVRMAGLYGCAPLCRDRPFEPLPRDHRLLDGLADPGGRLEPHHHAADVLEHDALPVGAVPSLDAGNLEQ